MCDVHQPVEMNQHEMSLGSASLSERDEVSFVKQVEKKRMITPSKIVIGLTLFFILSLVSYKLYTLSSATNPSANILNNQGKFIQNADSSSGHDSGSQTGSQGSRASKDSAKPLEASQTVGKDVIGPNMGSGGDGEDPSEQNNDGEKRQNLMKRNKMDGSSTTEDDSEEDDSDDISNEDLAQNMAFVADRGTTMSNVGMERPWYALDDLLN